MPRTWNSLNALGNSPMAWATAVLAGILLAGCASPPPAQSQVLSLEAREYNAAFDAAMAVADSHGLKPLVADRGIGIIETSARSAGSILEPWRTDNGSFAATMAHTVNFERRRMRVEFVPVGLSIPAPQPDNPVQAAAIPGSDRAEARFDLLRNEGPVEMRAWVYIERQFRPNQRIGDWTRAQTRFSIDPLQDPDPRDTTTSMPGTWTPVGRDLTYEQTVLAEIQQRLAALAAVGAVDNPQRQEP